MNRIYVYPWDQLSKSAGAIAVGLGTQKLLRKGSRYQLQRGDVIVNWGASDIVPWLDERLPYIGAAFEMDILNRDVSGALDKVAFFERLKGTGLTPAYETDKAAASDFLKFPVLCRTKTKGCDGAGIVIAETKIDMVEAKLFVELEPKTAEYRVHIGRDPQGNTSIIGVQQKFLPKGLVGKEKRLRTTANGCYFVWTVGGEQVENIVPPTVLAVTSAAFKLFPELTFCGADVIWNETTGKATVIEFNSAPEMTPGSVERYVKFFNQYREPVAEAVEPEVAVEMVNDVAANDVRLDEAQKDAWFEFLGDRPAYDVSQAEAFKAGWDARMAQYYCDKAFPGPQPLDDKEQDNYMYGRFDVV